MAEPKITIAIQETGKLFTCHPTVIIRNAEEGIKREFGLSLGVIELNGEYINPDRSFAEEIEEYTGEGIDSLQFNDRKFTNSRGEEFQFTFVHGEKKIVLCVPSSHLATTSNLANYHTLIRSGVVEDGYLVWDPPLDIDRHRRVQKIKIRECYPEIYNLILENYRKRITNHLVTGVPGIGKSYFCLYFLWRYLSISEDQSVMLELAFDCIMKLTPTRTIVSNRSSCFETNIPYLVDLIEQQEPSLRLGQFIVVFSSPDPGRCKEFKKYQTQQYIMPVWSKDEIDDLHAKQFPDVDGKSVEDLFAIVGGVPRLIFMESMTFVLGAIGDVISKKGVTIAQRCFTQGANIQDDDQSYLLIHFHPHPEQGYCTKVPIYMIASNYIWDRLSVVYSQVGLRKLTDTFDMRSFRGSSVGYIFQRLCLEGMPLNGKSFTLLSLTPSGFNPKQEMSINIPPTIQELSQTSQGKLSRGTLYYPKARNFESGDAFYQDRSTGVLFVFQRTVAQSHPMKAAGLDHICGLFTGIKDCHLVFVTPKSGILNSQQTITATTGKGEPIRRVSSFVRKFESHQWKLEYVFSATSSSPASASASTLQTQQGKRSRSRQSRDVVEEEEEEVEPLPSRSQQSRKKKQRTRTK